MLKNIWKHIYWNWMKTDFAKGFYHTYWVFHGWVDYLFVHNYHRKLFWIGLTVKPDESIVDKF